MFLSANHFFTTFAVCFGSLLCPLVPKAKFRCRLPDVVVENLDVFLFFHGAVYDDSVPWSIGWETPPKHEVPPTMFDSGDGVLRVDSFSFFTPNEGYMIVAKQFNFCIISP